MAMERLTIQVGLYEVNCSILSENGKAWIVDPGHEADRIAALLEKKELKPEAILLTHAHFDHIGAVAGLLERFPSLPVYIGEKDVAAHMAADHDASAGRRQIAPDRAADLQRLGDGDHVAPAVAADAETIARDKGVPENTAGERHHIARDKGVLAGAAHAHGVAGLKENALELCVSSEKTTSAKAAGARDRVSRRTSSRQAKDL